MRHYGWFIHTRALLGNRASQFIGNFDEIFRVEGLKILKTPVRAPVANSSRSTDNTTCSLRSGLRSDGLAIIISLHQEPT